MRFAEGAVFLWKLQGKLFESLFIANLQAFSVKLRIINYEDQLKTSSWVGVKIFQKNLLGQEGYFFLLLFCSTNHSGDSHRSTSTNTNISFQLGRT